MKQRGLVDRKNHLKMHKRQVSRCEMKAWSHLSPLSVGSRPCDCVPQCIHSISDGCFNELMFTSRSQVPREGNRLFTEYPLHSR